MSEHRTVFKRVDYDLSGLLQYIDMGDIGLPDIQRPFVWTSSKVRDLFDSMYRGFPVGHLLFWANADVNGSKTIGLEDKAHKVPSLLIVDGQQRLTSLYAVFKGKPVLDQNYEPKKIEIAFHPRDGKFFVLDGLIKNNPEYIPNISDVWASGKPSWSLINDFFSGLEEKQKLSKEEKDQYSRNIDQLFDLQRYPFTALEISPTVDEEQVADIFVRINSEGVKLNQADFILTLLSVFWDEGRMELEQFSRASRIPPSSNSGPSSFNHFIKPSPDQLLRVAIALGFHRGRLKSVYQVLRGKDIETGLYSDERRKEQFSILKAAQKEVLNLNNWQPFFGSLISAGFRSRDLISSENTLLYSYAFYLIGKRQYGVEENRLQNIIGRWFYAASISGHYTRSSPETTMDGDLNIIKDLPDSETFISNIERIIKNALTNDFWTIELPNMLETSSARSPALFAFYAAQNKLEAPVLFSKNKRISELFDPLIRSKRKPLEQHHIFPKSWLKSQGITDRKIINQVANFSLLDWTVHTKISDTPPYVYEPSIREDFKPEEWALMYKMHALPEDWSRLPYEEFLKQRRILMAQIIRRGFEALA